MTNRLVIVGAGQAAFALASKLRTLKDERPITILGDEPVPPYQRPPLSKKYLLGEMTFDRLTYRPDDWYVTNHVDLRLSTSVTRIDRAAKRVELADGTTLDYGTLVLATGATPRRLPAAIGGDLAGVFEVRNKADADQLAGEMQPGRHLLVVGGGYIGLEAAAVARKLGLEVVLIEAAERILRRVASAETATAMRAIHEAHGVVIRENTGLSRLMGENGRVVAAELNDGTTVKADFVVVGIGVTANDSLAREAGLETMNGIVVDEFARTADEAIYAAGDCATFPYLGRQTRLESVQNAVDQARCVAARLAGRGTPYSKVPWFWSDQGDNRLQIAGVSEAGDSAVLRGDRACGKFSVFRFRAGRLAAVESINSPADHMAARKLLAAGTPVTPEQAADASLKLATLLAP